MPKHHRRAPWWQRLYWGDTPLNRALGDRLGRWRTRLTARKLYWGGVPLSEASMDLVRQRPVQRFLKLATVMLLVLSVAALLLPGPVLKQLGDWWASLWRVEFTHALHWQHADKLGHASLFAALTIAVRVSWLQLSAQSAALLLLILALATELLQLPIPGRAGTLGDVAADGIGIAVGSALLWWLWPWLVAVLAKPRR